MRAAGDGHEPEGDDRGVGRRVQEAYATRVGIDTAARHLWSMDREARRLRRRRRRQRLVSAAASLVMLMAVGGTVAGSAMALPGEALYPVKESLERAELTIAFSDTANARAHLRHSRVRLDELEQAAESNPEVVPEIAERFYTSLERAAALGGESVAAEVAALRTSASLLMDRIARNLDPSIAESLTGARATRNDTTASDNGRQALARARSGDEADGGGGDTGPAGSNGADRDGAGADGGSADEAPEPMAPEPETTVADAEDDEPAELVEETATAEVPAETVVADPEETGTGESETSSGDADDEAGREDGAGDDGEQDAAAGEQPEDGPSLEGRTPESSTAESDSTSEASTSEDTDTADGDEGESDG